MLKSLKTSLVVILLLAVSLSACSGLDLSTLTSQVQPADQSVQAASPAGLQINETTTDLLAAYEGVLTEVYEKVNPSVVNIDVVITGSQQSQLFPGSQEGAQPTGTGSGFIWDTLGHIVTNNHVVDGASQITVNFADGSVAEAELVGGDANSDLAVIKVDVSANQLKPVDLADSDQVKVGEMAIAIGNPFGLSGTMTVGVISALDRSLPVGLDNLGMSSGPTYSIPDIIQTDASINPGNSGGVLVNEQGQLIGVTAAIASTVGANSGIGFVIPSRIVQKVVPTLIKEGKYDHSWMGISGTSLTPILARANALDENQRGVLVMQVTANSPAEKAGLRGGSQQSQSNNGNSQNNSQVQLTGGDLIIAVDGQAVKRFEDLVSYLYGNTQPGQKITLTVLRDGKENSVELTLGVLPK
jgi:2-alkenal reductase